MVHVVPAALWDADAGPIPPVLKVFVPRGPTLLHIVRQGAQPAPEVGVDVVPQTWNTSEQRDDVVPQTRNMSEQRDDGVPQTWNTSEQCDDVVPQTWNTSEQRDDVVP